MKATEIKPGDKFVGEGTRYVVEDVVKDGKEVRALVRFSDGGEGVRAFDLDQDVPLVR